MRVARGSLTVGWRLSARPGTRGYRGTTCVEARNRSESHRRRSLGVPPHASKRVLVVGYSLAGLSAALGLRNRGVAVDVIDQNCAVADVSYGRATVLSPNTMRLVKDLGVASKLLEAGVELEQLRHAKIDGKLQGRVEYSQFRQEFGNSALAIQYPAVVESFAGGLRAPYKGVPGVRPQRVHIKDVSPGQDGRLSLRFSGKPTTIYDAIVVAQKDIPPPVLRYISGYHDSDQLQTEKHLGYGCHAIFADRPAELSPNTAVQMWGTNITLHMTPTALNKICVWGTFIPKYGPAAAERFSDCLDDILAFPEQFKTTFTGFGVDRLIEQTLSEAGTNEYTYTSYPTELEASGRVFGRVALAGSASCILPPIGPQESLDIEDGYVLAQHIGRDLPVEDALRAYGKERTVRVKDVQRSVGKRAALSMKTGFVTRARRALTHWVIHSSSRARAWERKFNRTGPVAAVSQ